MSKNNIPALESLTLEQAINGLESNAFTSLELTDACLEQIARKDPEINAFITVNPEQARIQAQEADKRRAAGDKTPLLGIPIAIKDCIMTKGMLTTCASRILDNFIPPYDAQVVTKLKQAGAINIGKTNLDEFAMGSTTEHSAFGVVKNPLDTSRVAGGSSGGSAAAVAYGASPAAIGTDTGGSVRQPAAFVGAIGFKPTYGRISRWGLAAMASSLDQAGVITHTVRDAAILLNILAGHDQRDSTSVDTPVPDYLASLDANKANSQSLKGKKIAVITDLNDVFEKFGVHPGIPQALSATREKIQSLGAEIVETRFPLLSQAVSVYYVITSCEVSTNLARLDGMRYGHRREGADMADIFRKTRGQGFGLEAKRRILMGSFALSSGYYDAYYRKAAQVRRLVAEDFAKIHASCDAVLLPATPGIAFKIGEMSENAMSMYLADLFTVPASLAGLPAITFPAELKIDNMPVSMQLVGRSFAEDELLQITDIIYPR